ncbi:MAG: 30S ribosomal protein S20 [Deferribacterales bacterium]|nr:30S ribosomal protein S20 [Deferribacterales bacterium]
MAHTLSARKRIRQSEKRNLINRSNKSRMKTYVKKYTKALETGAENTEALLKEAVSVIYKTARKGAIAKKQASRRVSRLTLKFNAAKAAQN